MKRMRSISFLLGFSLILMLFLSGCAPEPGCETSPGGEAGFLSGLIHGVLLPVAVFGKLFSVETGLYAVSNSGFWYWLGYFIGIGGLGGGASQAGRRRR